MEEKEGYFSFSYLFSLILPGLVLLGLLSDDPLTSFFVISAIVILLFILIDIVSGKDKLYPYEMVCTQKNEAITPTTNNSLMFLYGVVFLQIFIIGVGLDKVSVDGAVWLPYLILIGYSSATCFLNVAHELYHTKNKFQTLIARIANALAFWGYDEIHHLYVHHRDEESCLPEDGVLSHLNQSLYAYWVQMICVGLKRSWQIQKELLLKKNQKIISFHNYVLISLLGSVVLALAILIFLGSLACLFFIGQATVAIMFFAMATYSQHYGLMRRKKSDGTYEDFTYMNVWSCNSRFGNRIYINLFKHAHHHLFIFCPYTELKLIEESPMMPTPAQLTLFMTLIPPLWYKVMNKEVEKVLKKRDLLEAQEIR